MDHRLSESERRKAWVFFTARDGPWARLAAGVLSVLAALMRLASFLRRTEDYCLQIVHRIGISLLLRDPSYAAERTDLEGHAGKNLKAVKPGTNLGGLCYVGHPSQLRMRWPPRPDEDRSNTARIGRPNRGRARSEAAKQIRICPAMHRRRDRRAPRPSALASR